MASGRTVKVISWSGLGGLVAGTHLTLLLTKEFAAWMVFNTILGIFCIYMAFLIAGEENISESKDLSDDED